MSVFRRFPQKKKYTVLAIWEQYFRNINTNHPCIYILYTLIFTFLPLVSLLWNNSFIPYYLEFLRQATPNQTNQHQYNYDKTIFLINFQLTHAPDEQRNPAQKFPRKREIGQTSWPVSISFSTSHQLCIFLNKKCCPLNKALVEYDK